MVIQRRKINHSRGKGRVGAIYHLLGLQLTDWNINYKTVLYRWTRWVGLNLSGCFLTSQTSSEGFFIWRQVGEKNTGIQCLILPWGWAPKARWPNSKGQSYIHDSSTSEVLMLVTGILGFAPLSLWMIDLKIPLFLTNQPGKTFRMIFLDLCIIVLFFNFLNLIKNQTVRILTVQWQYLDK